MVNINDYHKFMRGKNKYRAVRTPYNGIVYASKKEAQRARELDMLGKAGIIKDLERQKDFPVVINGKTVFKYVSDFCYWDNVKNTFVIEDVKGVRTALFNLKKKCVEAQYGITINLI